MRVLHLIDHLGLGGEQRVLADLADTRSAGLQLEVLSLSSRVLAGLASEIARAGVPVRTLALSSRSVAGPLRLRREIERGRFDVLHTHLEFSGTFGAAAALSLGASRPAVVVTVVNDPQMRYPALHRELGRLLAPRVDVHVACSSSIADAVRRAYRGRPRRLEVITPGLDLARWRGPESVAPLIDGRAAQLRGGARRVVGAVGRLAEQKAFHLLLEATPRLLAADPSTRVLLVGGGPLRAALETQARQLGVAHAVLFTGPLDDPRPAYRAMDVFVLPSLDEGFGIASVEAMISGVPVVATRVVGTVDAVRDGETGLLVPPNDSAALAAAILRVLEDRDLAAGLRRRAARWAAARDRADVTLAYEALYRELVAARRAAGRRRGSRARDGSPAALVPEPSPSPRR